MPATHSEPKTERVVSRVSPEVKALLAQAASWAGFSSIDQFIVQSIYRGLYDYDGFTHSSAARYCFGKGEKRRCLLNFWITICATA